MNLFQLNEYFYQLPGNAFLGLEEKKQADEVRREVVKKNWIRSASREYKVDEFRIEQGKLQLGEYKISIDFIEDEIFHDIISIMVFLITICEEDNFVIQDKEIEHKGRMYYETYYEVQKEASISVMEQYYQSMWMYSALQAYRDELVKGYKDQILGPGYFGMPIEENESIYMLLKGNQIGVTLHASCQFTPENTICGIACKVGDHKKRWDEFVSNPCRTCIATNKACGYCTFKKKRK